MSYQGNIRFSLLLGWCSLLTFAMVIIAVVLATGTTFRGQQRSMGEDNLTENILPSTASFRGSPTGQPLTDHIHLIYDVKNTWKPSSFLSDKSSFITFQNNLVKVKAAGIYYAYAQVTFLHRKADGEETVALVMNENIPDVKPRKLMEAQKHGIGTVSMSKVMKLMENDCVNLIVSNTSMIFSHEISNTYWGLFMLAKMEDK
ncbi:lymphotoxin-alpha [Electrophorus electricus]|uniref:lymphotoxin-alpha n=1 Tax=Electrophorus electricus TaxID=8005 RepID=UPI0015D04BC1|nr:lymphotoxin-alpha [Electrophorus electricus]